MGDTLKRGGLNQTSRDKKYNEMKIHWIGLTAD